MKKSINKFLTTILIFTLAFFTLPVSPIAAAGTVESLSIFQEPGIIREGEGFTLVGNAVNDSGYSLFTPYQDSTYCGITLRYPQTEAKNLESIFSWITSPAEFGGATVQNLTSPFEPLITRAYQGSGLIFDSESLYFLNIGASFAPNDEIEVRINTQLNDQIVRGEQVYLSNFACGFRDSNGGETTIHFTTPGVEVPLNISGPTSSVYRFYNPTTGAHFYTSSVTQRDRVINNYPQFDYEGASYSVFNSNDGNVTPVYRFYNYVTGAHFYTASASQRDRVIANYPQFQFEGINHYVFAASAEGRKPMYRFYNTDTGTHFYTARESEKNRVISNYPQFDFEGIAYYVPE